MSGSTNYGLIENAITHPSGGLFAQPGYPAGGLGENFANSSQFEADQFPRAIVSRMKMYYPDGNFPVSGTTNSFTNEYYGQTITDFADANHAATFPASLSLLSFPLMPLGITPSVSVYKK
jgi:hypothetical protein